MWVPFAFYGFVLGFAIGTIVVSTLAIRALADIRRAVQDASAAAAD